MPESVPFKADLINSYAYHTQVYRTASQLWVAFKYDGQASRTSKAVPSARLRQGLVNSKSRTPGAAPTSKF